MADRRARPKAGLSRERVLDAALDLVDREGVASLTMRKLGAELGVEAMTLYHHVGNKGQLLDALVGRVVRRAALGLPGGPAPSSDADADAEAASPADASEGAASATRIEPVGANLGAGDWTRWARAFACGLRAELLRHPGVLPLIATRPLSSADDLDLLEEWLAALTDAGLGLGRAMDVINALATFVVGHTLAEAGRAPGERTDAPDLDDAAPDPKRFPLLAEVTATRVGLDFEARFDRTVDFILAGYRNMGED
ncbi:TetR/AcrR family transcriptional regulator C-terminal domain-containing protein [Streptomyces sp. ASQP_92]|uniref:TetR/AcrR family transcriptional regulator C-terminal domain-containing protein n=1 Tax=Streptomyces sp. ASQP_92 TaxID=2979116 RepID=UPI0021C1F843|nr:TetR/AcrR family transcriptional regulator C-terminal domain-containing protein [Streptomyces sp. ASQP_92]MCT9090095.1 TetR/AcrR family transcriptional regulator C-terminal domain-containing protein [Streptomyces sp. ASQP_92]